MLEAKDTVMSLPLILEAIKYEDGEVGTSKFCRLAKTQAEISFKAGKLVGYDEGLVDKRAFDTDIAYKAGYEQAIKDYGVDTTTSGVV